MATTDMAQAQTTMRCLRALQRYWTVLHPSDHLPYRVIGALMSDNQATLDILLPNLSDKIIVLNEFIVKLDASEGLIVAARHTLLAVHELASGWYDNARDTITIAENVPLQLSLNEGEVASTKA